MSVKLTPTNFMIALKEKIKAERNLTDSSVNLYLSNLVLLNEKKPFNNLGFLKKNKDLIIEHLSQYADSTEINYITAIVVALSTVKDQHLYKTIFKFYSELLRQKSDIQDGVDKKVMTPAQKENWLAWNDVETKWKTLKEEVDKFKGDRSISRKNFETLVDYLVLSLYFLVPPRRNADYLNMFVLLRDVKSDDLEPEIKNYLDIQNEEFIFNQYKTAKFYGQQKEKIPEELMNVIRIWLKFHPTLNGMTGKKAREVKLFVNHEGVPQSLVNFITLRLNKIFGRKVASTMLRHIYITHKFGDEFEEMSKTAQAMGHSLSEQRDYAKRVEKTE